MARRKPDEHGFILNVRRGSKRGVIGPDGIFVSDKALREWNDRARDIDCHPLLCPICRPFAITQWRSIVAWMITT